MPRPIDPSPPPPKSSGVHRLVAALVLLAFAGAAAYLFLKTPLGTELRHRETVSAWVAHHRVLAPLILVSLYVLFTALMLPVWELQVAAGFGFGLLTGIVWCELAATISAVVSLLLSRWLVGEWFRARYEARMAKLHALNEKLGHNGLLVVMGVRLCHVLPFALSNYLFGLTRITVMDVLLGTFAGSVPMISVGVAVGVGEHLLREWQFWTILAAVNVVLLIPLALRYLKPAWFRKIGVE